MLQNKGIISTKNSINKRCYFLKDGFSFIGRADFTKREGEREVFFPPGSLLQWPQWLELNRSEANSYDFVSGIPCRCRFLSLWAILYHARPQTGSWMGHGAAGTQTSIHIGSWRMKHKNLATEVSCQAQQELFQEHLVQVISRDKDPGQKSRSPQHEVTYHQAKKKWSPFCISVFQGMESEERRADRNTGNWGRN